MHHMATPKGTGHHDPVVAPASAGHARMPEIRGRATIITQAFGRVFGPKGDTHSFSNRGKESRGIVPTPPTAPPQDLGKRPTIPPPSVSQRPITCLAPVSAKLPLRSRPARESVQPPKTPSVTFGGYRGDKEARGQSLRGQASRQSSTMARPPSAPP